MGNLHFSRNDECLGVLAMARVISLEAIGAPEGRVAAVTV
jgi:hypothetical protein